MKLSFGLITMLLSTLGATGMGSMLKILGGAFQGISEEMQKSVVNSSETCRFVNGSRVSKNYSLVKLIKTQACLLGLLVLIAFMRGCSTLQSSRCSAPSSLTQPSLPSHHQKIKEATEILWGLSHSQVEQKSPLPSLWTSISCRNHHFGSNHWILFHTRRINNV